MTPSSDPLFSLGDILGGFSFQIPEYQRGYSWSSDQWKDLWQDLSQVVQRGSLQHFTGNLFLRRLAGESASGSASDGTPDKVEVVDGQQRLITTMLLSRVLAVRAGRVPPVHRLVFKANEELQTYFDYCVLGHAALAPRLSREPSSYALRLQQAQAFFEAAVGTLSPEQAGAWCDVLLSRFRLFVLEVSPDFDVHVAFETLNNRGRHLSQMELLKNRLIYLSTVLPAEPGQAHAMQRQIHLAWKGIYRALGRSVLTQDHDDEFLVAHATCWFSRKRDANWLSNTLFTQHFSLTNTQLNLADIGRYVQGLETAAAWWSHLHAPKDLPPAHQLWLSRLARAGLGHFKPLLLAAYLRAASVHPQVVVNPAAHESALQPVLPLLEQVERFIVVVYRLLGKQGSLGRADMHWCAHTLCDAGRDAEFTREWGVTLDGPASAIAVVTGFVAAQLDNAELDDGSFSDPRFHFSGLYSTDDVLQVVDKRFRQHDGYYHWAFTRLALFEYEEAFRGNGASPVKMPWEQVSFDETVEHIYPQNPSGTGLAYWSEHVPMDGRSNRNGKLGDALKNALGNLLLLSRGDNSSASNHAYTDKLPLFRNNTYSSTEVAQHFDHWNALIIAVRSVAMLRFIERRWGIELSATPADLGSYLPLCFGSQHEAVVSGKAGRKVQLGRHAAKVHALGPAG